MSGWFPVAWAQEYEIKMNWWRFFFNILYLKLNILFSFDIIFKCLLTFPQNWQKLRSQLNKNRLILQQSSWFINNCILKISEDSKTWQSVIKYWSFDGHVCIIPNYLNVQYQNTFTLQSYKTKQRAAVNYKSETKIKRCQLNLSSLRNVG